MKPVFLTDQETRDQLYPFTRTRSVADIRIGILTIREKWELLLGHQVPDLPDNASPEDAVLFASNIIPSQQFIESLMGKSVIPANDPDWDTVRIIQYPWHIFQWNDWALREDFLLVTKGRKSEPVPSIVQTINPENIFIEPGARLTYCVLNASTGPIYIGRNAEVMEGALIRGPFAICEGAVVKMGAKVYGATTVGPYGIIGGEVKNSVLFGYSNKSHDGYLGDAVIGEWCNLGGGTSTSNLKNNATDVRVYHYPSKDYIRAGQKCGLLMGDYSRSAINTSFNTGTVVGVCANVFGEGLTPKYIPDFTWGNKGLTKYEFEKALTDIANWKKFKNQELTESEISRLKHIFEAS